MTQKSHKKHPGMEFNPDSRRSLLESIASNTRDAILLTEAHPIDEPGPRIVYVNEAFSRMTGYALEEIAGRSPRLLQGVETDRAALDEIRGALESHEAVRVELANYRKDGTKFWVEVDISPGYGEDGDHTHWVSVQRDVTERRAREEALRESEERLRAVLVQHASEMITVLERDGSIRYQSPAITDLLGYALEEVVGKSLISYIHPEDTERIRSELSSITQTPGVSSSAVETRIRHADGTWRCIEGIGNNLLGDPQVAGVVINSRDITERKEAEEKLQEAEERYRTLVENVPAVVYIDNVDETNSVIYRSPYVSEVLGYDPDEFLSRPDFWQNILHPEDRERVLAENKRTNETGEPFRIEYRMIHKDGHAVWIRDEAVLISDEDGNPKFWQGYFTDMTERKEAEDRLREAEVRYRTLVEEVPAVTYVHLQKPGEPSVTSYISPQVETILGYSPEEYASVPDFWESLLHPEDRERVLAEDLRTGQTGDVFREEFRMIARDGRTVWLREDGRLARVEEDGTEVWQGIMFDITELKQTEARLRNSEERYRALVEDVPAIIYLANLSSDGTTSYEVTYMSPRIEEILGYPAQRFVEDQDLWNGIIHPDDLPEVIAEDERTDQTGDPFLMEYRMLAHDGRVVWIREEAVLVRGPENEPLYWQGVMNDVTSRRQAQDALRESEQKYRSVIENVGEVLFETDAQGTYTFLSPAWQTITGFSIHESLGKSLLQYIHPDDLERNLKDAESMGEHSEEEYADYEARYQAKDGSPRDVEIKFREHFDAAGNLTGTSGTINDITDRKKTEAALKESEERFRQLFEQSVDAIYVHDEEGRFVDCNAQACRLLGYTREELISLSIEDVSGNLCSEEDRQPQERSVPNRPRALDEEPGVFSEEHEEEHIRKDGTRFPVEVRVGSVDYGGRRMILAAVRDITERREAQEALEENERRFRSMIQNAPDGISILDADSTIRYDSPAIERVLGYTPEERIGTKGFDYVHPKDIALARRTFAEVAETPEVRITVEYRLRHKDGSWRFFEATRTNLLDDPAVGGIVLNYRDITERRRAEEKLRESEAEQRRRARDLSLLHEVRSALSLELNAADVCRATVEAVAKSYGYVLVSAYLVEDEELIMQHQVGYVTQLRRIPADRGVMWRTVRSGEPVLLEDVHENTEFLDAIQGIVSEVCVPLFDEDRVIGTLNVESTEGTPLDEEDLRLLMEVGEHAGVALGRARLYARVKQAEDRFRGAFENASTGVALVSLDNYFLTVNPALRDMLGYSEEELLEKRTFDLTHPEDQVKSRGRRRTLEKDGPSVDRTEKRYIRKDGGVVWAISAVSLVRDSEGNPSHFVSHFQDITERKKLEEQLSYQALHDTLTGLPNRSALHSRFERVVGHLADYPRDQLDVPLSETRYVAVLFMDLDGFKAVNDSLGHAAGDEILRAVAERLRNVVRPRDTVARLGGDEFCVLLAGISGTAEAIRIAERLKRSVDAPFSITLAEPAAPGQPNTSTVDLSTSIGIAVSEPGGAGTPLDELLREADAAMYRAKKRGGALYEVVELQEDTG